MEPAFNESIISNIKPIRDIVYETLRTTILQGDLKPGERIIEKEYADKYKISRTPVREAIRKLEIEGFVEYIPRKGVVVKAFDARDIGEIFAIRTALECLAIKSTLVNISEEEIEHLKALTLKMEEFYDNGDLPAFFNICKDFNEAILKASKMPRLIQMINTLQDFLERFRKITLTKLQRRSNAVAEHKAILQAIIEKDEERAQKLTIEHIEGSKWTLLQSLGINK